MKRSLSLALALLLALAALTAGAGAAVFDPAPLVVLPGFSVEEDGAWRYEQAAAWEDEGDFVRLGFVVEGQPGEGQEAPWLWAEYLIGSEAQLIDAVTLSAQGTTHRYVDLDLGDDESYATWSLGLQGENLLRDLARGGGLLLTLHTNDGEKEVSFPPEDMAEVAAWSAAMIDQGYLRKVDSVELAHHDSQYLLRRGQPRDPGSFDYTAFEPETGFRVDKIDQTWRFERQADREGGGRSLSLGLVAEGQLAGPLHPPWMWAELAEGGQKLRVGALKLLVDDTLYSFNQLVVREGYSSWTLGLRSGRLLSQLPAARELVVKLFSGDYTYDFTFDEAALQPLILWGQALRRTGLTGYLDQEMLSEFDLKYEVRVE